MKDLVLDAWRGVARRSTRAALTALGVGLGVGALVAVIGLADSASLQIAERFDAYAATAVDVTLPGVATQRSEAGLTNGLKQLPGVRSAGTFTELDGEAAAVVATSRQAPEGRTLPVAIASHDGLHAASARVISGILPSDFQWNVDEQLIVIGSGVAGEFGVSATHGANVLRLNGQPFTVVAVVRDRGSDVRLSGSVILGLRGASLLEIGQDVRSILIRTDPGYGQLVAANAALATLPESPDTVIVTVPPDPTQLRGQISSDTRNLLVGLGVVTLLAGAVGIANILLISVWERRAEIGLRRALGGSRIGVAGVFLIEALFLGTIGGTIGAAAGVLGAWGFTDIRGWDLSLPPWIFLAPLLGTGVGLLAGLHPAFRAASVQPAEALRS